MDVLLRLQEKRENIYTKKDIITVQSAFFFSFELSRDWHGQLCVKCVKFLRDAIDWKMIKAKIVRSFEKRKEEKKK